MKRVVGISLGSSRRDHRVQVELLGTPVEIRRQGTDGDLEKAVELVRQLDGQVDAFGMGGIDLYLQVRRRRYTLRDARRLLQAARKTPIVDGNGLKNSLEPWVIQQLQTQWGIPLRGRKVLMVSAVDRFAMAEAFARSGCQVLFGDLIFALGIPIGIRSLATLERIARLALPVITQLPFRVLYPLGSEQERITPRFTHHYEWADVIAGDFHLIRRYMPPRLEGKIVLTNTVTSQDVEELRQRGVKHLITTTPHLNGRSFGTNVMEATLVALAGAKGELPPEAYLELLRQLQLRPHVLDLQEDLPQDREAGAQSAQAGAQSAQAGTPRPQGGAGGA